MPPPCNLFNRLLHQLITGLAKEECPPSRTHFFVDVRDLALSNILAVEKNEAAGKRFLLLAGKYCNKQIVEAIYANFPLLRDTLPQGDALKLGDFNPYFSGTWMSDCSNQTSREVLGTTYRPLVESVVDAVKSWQWSKYPILPYQRAPG